MERCNVIFPGSFKPVHAGHILMMLSYLDSKKYDVYLTVVISKSPREGLSYENSKWFLEKYFENNKKVKIIVSEDTTPIVTTYNIIGEHKEGKGIYAMATSSKGDDIKRAEDIVQKFSKDGKYYDPKVKVILFPINYDPILYDERKDIYYNKPISSSIIRKDLRSNESSDKKFKFFKLSYNILLKNKLIDESLLMKYYNKLIMEKPKLDNSKDKLYDDYNKNEKNNIILESGAAGHMNHPYDIDNFTFNDLIDLIHDLFAGEINDISEKLDGQNIFASVDLNGNTIFARNNSQLYEEPLTYEKMLKNEKWQNNPGVMHAFTNGAKTIEKVFNNIPNKIKFFNYKNSNDFLQFTYWVNCEILDTENYNVIPYLTSTVSFHGFKATVKDIRKDAAEYNKPYIIDINEADNKFLKNILDKAIKKAEKTYKLEFKAQLTPDIILKKIEHGEQKANYYYNLIDHILADANQSSFNITLREYKQEMLIRYLESSSDLKFIDNEVLSFLLVRWIDNKKQNKISDIEKNNLTLSTGEVPTKKQIKIISDFDKNEVSKVISKIMKPLDTLFIKLGNEIIKNVNGLTNDNNKSLIIKKLHKELINMESLLKKVDDPKIKEKLQTSIQRLSTVNNELNATEGIVFKYKDHILKLTGSFAPLNQIIGLKNRLNNE